MDRIEAVGGERHVVLGWIVPIHGEEVFMEARAVVVAALDDLERVARVDVLGLAHSLHPYGLRGTDPDADEVRNTPQNGVGSPSENDAVVFERGFIDHLSEEVQVLVPLLRERRPESWVLLVVSRLLRHIDADGG
jgi:hypothetical protein